MCQALVSPSRLHFAPVTWDGRDPWLSEGGGGGGGKRGCSLILLPTPAPSHTATWEFSCFRDEGMEDSVAL